MKYLVLGLILFFSGELKAQQHVFADVQVDYGYLFRSFDQKGDVLKANSLGSEMNFRPSLSYRIFNRLQVAAGVGVSRQSIKLHDADFEARNEGFEVPIRIKTTYSNYFFSLKYSQRIDNGMYVYGQIGYDKNFIKADQITKSDTYVVGFEDLQIQTTYADQSYSLTPEIGLESFLNNGGMFGVGIKYSMMNTPLLTANYTVTSGNKVVASDVMKISGSNIAFTFHYHHLLWHKTKKEKPIRIVKVPVVVDEPVKEEPAPVTVTKGEANDRDYQVTNKIRVHTADVRIEIWDHQMEDGDIVSLILNDQWIIQNYTLERKKKVFYVTLHEGHNTFVLYAHNLGKYAPNTASILVFDGEKEHTLVLESDLKESGALDIKYVPKK